MCDWIDIGLIAVLQ